MSLSKKYVVVLRLKFISLFSSKASALYNPNEDDYNHNRSHTTLTIPKNPPLVSRQAHATISNAVSSPIYRTAKCALEKSRKRLQNRAKVEQKIGFEIPDTKILPQQNALFHLLTRTVLSHTWRVFILDRYVPAAYTYDVTTKTYGMEDWFGR